VGALAAHVAVLKPQSAFFERFGSRGIAVLETVISEARSAGALVLLDVKRGDIGSTTQAYADAYLDPASPLAADAVTATPYLGFGSLRPMIDTALAHQRGVFVLALTSNPEGHTVQHARRADGRTVAQAVLDEIASLNEGARPLGSVGAVVGATVDTTGGGADHDLANINGPLLAPGLGTQGGRPADLRRVFGTALPWVLPSYSREIVKKGPDSKAMREAMITVRNECASVLERSA
jgi:orotidine-5'-phosphate decarboxylase